MASSCLGCQRKLDCLSHHGILNTNRQLLEHFFFLEILHKSCICPFPPCIGEKRVAPQEYFLPLFVRGQVEIEARAGEIPGAPANFPKQIYFFQTFELKQCL